MAEGKSERKKGSKKHGGGRPRVEEYVRVSTTIPKRIADKFQEFIDAMGLQENTAYAYALQVFLESRKDTPAFTFVLDKKAIVTSEEMINLLVETMGDTKIAKQSFVDAALESVEYLALYLHLTQYMGDSILAERGEETFFREVHKDQRANLIRIIAALTNQSEDEAERAVETYRQKMTQMASRSRNK
ncbi:hypothetical protein [Rhizobium sp. P44RR-XXIV]|uniref:hypothetical protein n=1 Tax=Rhizobium sp. P44RR-XXIV TaxID=1921145 RepID=UPI000985FDB5|nr:hypothetical protein [Rhizobium sp. P44RR-XXIV]TIX91609.1 hypothetical protein BSK43_011800 [Rhizobium sp. P44RR-XXIV]